jgi:hypothetical protein
MCRNTEILETFKRKVLVIFKFLLKGIYDRILNFKKKLPNGENLPKELCGFGWMDGCGQRGENRLVVPGLGFKAQRIRVFEYQFLPHVTRLDANNRTPVEGIYL